MREYGVNSLSELQADNIYLKGGSNMAEALQRRNAHGETGGGQPISIAMRMKRNREALQMAVKVQDDDEYGQEHSIFHLNP